MADHQLHSEPRGERSAHALRAEAQDLFNQLAQALTRGDGARVAMLWETPAIVIADEGVIAVATAAQVAEYVGGAKDQYNARGIVDTRADIRDLERIGERIVIASVRWPYLDAAGKTVGAESSDYTLRRDDTGALRIRSVLMHGVEPGTH
jgi:hypothetical protein